ncbi:probable cytosolic oligopeptidase A [Selaginella moellendorffii]|uniref:probable cytosolic oligopeptidase A n=1 Tax=Selaginella moellendorffii TaxID=88036 RepID=UPI000D1CDF57|nr:probable cytosolic oligopeptidase A [Selaginella moellendorffii]|eukprot:XP_024526948.1 probable cytosolic oligopeptidase A [Selaginella moellendorffii]
MKKVIISGVHLEDGQKKLFNQYEKELVELTRKFSDNILDSIRKYGKLVTSVEEVEGLPATSLALAAKAAASEGYEVASPELGPWLFKIDKSSYFRVMKHLKNRKAREELYLAYRNKASTGEFNNTPVLTRILELRNLKAKLLGYKNYAEISMLLKMATLDKANELLESLRSGAWDGALRELEALKALAASNGENYELMPWDLPYWMERLREARLDMSEEEFRPFFAFPHVLEGLFLLAKRLFSIEIDAADNLVATSIWHDDVRFFRVKDMDTKETLAYFYIDPYSRPLEKRGGAFVSSFVAKRSRALAPEGCDIRLPACIIVCNQTPPLGDNPSLMTFDEVLLAAVDLKLHSNFEPNGLTTKIHEVYSELSLKTQIPPCMPGEQYLCSFSHISTAGYYGYKAVKEVGMRFRNTILALGGGMAALDVFKAFRGREPSVDPLLRQYGLRK